MHLLFAAAIAARAPPCDIGSPPWDRDFLKAELPKFSTVFANRPSFSGAGNRYNEGGTGFFHAFYLWALVRWLQPLHIMESGAFNGMGTWVLRQAAPTAQIIVITPEIPSLYRDNRHDSRYFAGAKHFIDFTYIDWDCLKVDKERTLLFFDDHQAGYRRMLEASARGFKHLAFDDNYPNGDNFAPYPACQGGATVPYYKKCTVGENKVRTCTSGDKKRFADFFPERKNKPFLLDVSQMASIGRSFAELVEVYYEFPLIWDGPNRLMDLDAFRNSTAPPLLTPSEAADLHARYKSALRPADAETRAYTFLPYIKLRSGVGPLYWPPQVNGTKARPYVSPSVLPPPAASCKGAPPSTAKPKQAASSRRAKPTRSTGGGSIFSRIFG